MSTELQNKDTYILSFMQSELSYKNDQIKNVIALHEEGCTIPFIARYRKERTQGLDEVQIKDILDTYEYILNLEKRKEEVIRIIDERGKLTEELRIQIQKAKKLQVVEDLYLPYKEKRRTKATIAKEKGLEPLAKWILSFESGFKLSDYASEFLNDNYNLTTIEEVLSGAKDIIVEIMSEDPKVRDYIRKKIWKQGIIRAALKNEALDEKGVYKMYYDHEEPLARVQAHRILAMNRGEKEDVLKVSLSTPEGENVRYIERIYTKEIPFEISQFVKEAAVDAYKKYILPSIEREVRKDLTEKSQEQAIKIFSENVKQLFMQPPLKNKTVLAVDPAYRTGCKLGLIDEIGKVLYIGVIYPHKPKSQWEESKKLLLDLVRKHKVDIIAVGNGTASRETEELVAQVTRETNRETSYIIVNEAGASVYSASDIAREEFPNLQVEERSAVSIGRRIQDPLAELVKIDPKSVGVGQYQHDLPQKQLSESLQFTVETVVNQVGVNVNTASISLLQYVSGLSKVVAKNLVQLREEKGKFNNRKELKSVPRLGAKTYEQAIGFLRILDGDHPFDKTSIHPERYSEALQLLKRLGFTPEEIGKKELNDVLSTLNVSETAQALSIGEFTLQDIVDALARPMRDPREALTTPLLRKDVLQMEEIKPGMQFEGTVRNITDFGVFIDIGVKQDGLVHKSKLTKKFIKHPMDVVSVGQIVTVWVEGVDTERNRISLTMVGPTIEEK